MTAISVSERLLEMTAFYTWLDFTLTRKENSAASGRDARPLRCPMFAYGVMPAALMFSRMSAGHFLQRQRKVTICALVQSALGLNVVLVVPLVMFSLTAHSTALA